MCGKHRGYTCRGDDGINIHPPGIKPINVFTVFNELIVPLFVLHKQPDNQAARYRNRQTEYIDHAKSLVSQEISYSGFEIILNHKIDCFMVAVFDGSDPTTIKRSNNQTICYPTLFLIASLRSQ